VKRLIARRPTPATVIACVALFVSLGGVSYGVATGSIDSREIKNGAVQTQDIRNETLQAQDIRSGGVHSADLRNDSIRTEDLRNNEVRGVDIRNSTIRGFDIALNTLTGEDIRENTLATVPSATTADTLDGLDSSAFARPDDLGRFSVKLALDGSQVVATHGQVSVSAECLDNGAAANTVRLLASTNSSQAFMDGVDIDDDHLNAPNYLSGATLADDRELATSTQTAPSTPEVEEINGGGFVIGPDGRALHLQGGSTVLGFDYAGAGCIVAGEVSRTG